MLGHQMIIEEIFAQGLVGSMNIHQNISNLFSFFREHQKPDQDLNCYHSLSGEMLLMPKTGIHKLTEHWTASFFPVLIEVQNGIYDQLESRY